jgi:hypothetical protein
LYCKQMLEGRHFLRHVNEAVFVPMFL